MVSLVLLEHLAERLATLGADAILTEVKGGDGLGLLEHLAQGLAALGADLVVVEVKGGEDLVLLEHLAALGADASAVHGGRGWRGSGSSRASDRGTGSPRCRNRKNIYAILVSELTLS